MPSDYILRTWLPAVKANRITRWQEEYVTRYHSGTNRRINAPTIHQLEDAGLIVWIERRGQQRARLTSSGRAVLQAIETQRLSQFSNKEKP
jgi:ribosomal protein S19E (S16A)